MIYKYYRPDSHSEDNLRNSVLRCRHYEDFNDPFEFWTKFQQGVPTIADSERLKAAFTTWGFPDGDPQTLDDWKEYFDSLEGTEPNFVAASAHVRISCFCRRAENLLMWSHYADGMRGFCLGFDDDQLRAADGSVYITDVQYLDSPPVVDCFVYAVAEDQYEFHEMALHELAGSRRTGMQRSDADYDEAYRRCSSEALELMRSLWRAAFAAKPKEWEYEQEVRLLIHSDDKGREPLSWPFPRAALRQIILGERMTPAARDRLMSIADQFPHVELLTARRSTEAYEVALQPLS